jgi:two-component system chemotaxis response regulator CheY
MIDTGSTDTSTSDSTEDSGARKGGMGSIKMKEAVPLNDGDTRKRKALVIEDSMVVRKSLTRVLTKLGFETTQAVDGMEGLKELQCSLFDVVFCDFLMPVMDGLDCVQQYREWEANHCPFFRQHIVGISAHAGEEDVSEGLEAGMDDFRPKPVTYKQLVEFEHSEELKIVSGILDEIAAAGTLMVNVVEDSPDDESFENGSCEASNPAELGAERKKTRQSNSSIHFCLVGIEKGKTDIAILESASSKSGWKIGVVHNGEDVLRLMKMRNWDLVLMDEDLPILQCSQCIARFREWEEKNRVNRQKNIVLLSASGLTTVVGSKSMVQLPFGFDVSLGMPIRLNEFEYLMAQAERSESDFGVRDFVTR